MTGKVLHLTALCILLASLMGISGVGLAQEEDAPEPRPAILDVDLSNLESIGTIRDTRDGALGRGLWADSDRKELAFLIRALKAPVQSPANRFLTWGILRTGANAALINEEENFEPGSDLLTARMEKLIAFGAYEDALEMYTKMDREPYHPELARLGLLSMLYNRDKAQACLEYKTMEDRAFEGDFWFNIKAYCAHVLDLENKDAHLENAKSAILKSILDDGDTKQPYDDETFKETDHFDRAILAAENRLVKPDLDPETIATMPLSDIGIFLSDDTLTNAQNFFLSARAATLGLLAPKELQTLYNTLYTSGLDNLKYEEAQRWQRFVLHFKNINNADRGRAQWDIFFEAAEKADLYGIGALFPFADIISQYEIDGLSKREIMTAINLLYHTDQDIPGQWTEYFLRKQDGEFADKELALLAIASAVNTTIDNEDVTELLGFLDENNTATGKNLSIIIENIDKSKNNIHNPDIIYDNHFVLTFDDSYVMPTLRVWDRMNLSSQNGQIGITILLGSQILREWEPAQQYPGFVRDVFENFNNVGLTNVTQMLKIGLALDYINNK